MRKNNNYKINIIIIRKYFNLENFTYLQRKKYENFFSFALMFEKKYKKFLIFRYCEFSTEV